MPVALCFLLGSCGSKRNTANDQPDEPVFGTYQFGNSGKFVIELKSDSTAVMDLKDLFDKENTGKPVIHKVGVFTCRNDSIFISWENGNKIKSKFERKKDRYSFRNGATIYERKL